MTEGEEQTRTRNQADSREAGHEIEIDASPERVWKALTDPEELVRWFPLEAKVEPGPEGRIWMSSGNEYGGWSPVEAWDPPHRLRTAWVVTEGGATQVTEYRIEGVDGRTKLRVVTSGFPPDAAWDDMVEGTRLGWVFELHQIKHYLERHPGEDRRAAFLRRRVGHSRGEAWARLMGEGGLASALRGRVFDRTEPWQLALISEDPPGGVLRLTVDPSHDEPDARDVSVWVAGWGAAGERVEPVAGKLREELAQHFPEGRSLDARQ